MVKEKVVIITGPSGAGKSSVAFELLKRNKNFAKIISYTTRTIRENEQNGVHYHFVTEQQFKERIEHGDFFEWEINYGNYYGNSRKDIEEMWKKGQTPLLVIDIKGALTFKKKIPESLVFFVKSDSVKNLMSRLKKRGSIAEADFETRMKATEEEIELAKKCDYVVINKENCLEETVDDIEKILKSV